MSNRKSAIARRATKAHDVQRDVGDPRRMEWHLKTPYPKRERLELNKSYGYGYVPTGEYAITPEQMAKLKAEYKKPAPTAPVIYGNSVRCPKCFYFGWVTVAKTGEKPKCSKCGCNLP